MRENITKHYSDVLPKIKGWVWSVGYFDTHPSIGNVSIYLRQRRGSGQIHTYLEASESSSVEEVQQLIGEVARKLEIWVKDFHVPTTKGHTVTARLDAWDKLSLYVDGQESNKFTQRGTLYLDSRNPRERVSALLQIFTREKTVPSNLTGGE